MLAFGYGVRYRESEVKGSLPFPIVSHLISILSGCDSDDMATLNYLLTIYPSPNSSFIVIEILLRPSSCHSFLGNPNNVKSLPFLHCCHGPCGLPILFHLDANIDIRYLNHYKDFVPAPVNKRLVHCVLNVKADRLGHHLWAY